MAYSQPSAAPRLARTWLNPIASALAAVQIIASLQPVLSGDSGVEGGFLDVAAFHPAASDFSTSELASIAAPAPTIIHPAF